MQLFLKLLIATLKVLLFMFLQRETGRKKQKMFKEGQVLESEDDNIVELNMLAQVFADKQLPILKALHIA